MGWSFTRHAEQRLEEMGLPPGVAMQVIEAPELDYSAPWKHRRFGDERVATRGQLAVCYGRQRQLVITVLYNTAPLDGAPFKRGEDSPYASSGGGAAAADA